MTSYKVLMMNPTDSVGIALERIPEGTELKVNCENNSYQVQLKETIEFGHKFAVKSIAKGEEILKYGEVIGKASKAIEPGYHVHIHNLEGIRGRGDIVGTV
jgi:altronate dehydratase small subunit